MSKITKIITSIPSMITVPFFLLFFSLLFSLYFTYGNIHNAEKELEKERIHNSKIMMDVLQSVYERTGTVKNDSSITDIIASLSANADIQLLAMVDDNGKVFISTHKFRENTLIIESLKQYFSDQESTFYFKEIQKTSQSQIPHTSLSKNKEMVIAIYPIYLPEKNKKIKPEGLGTIVSIVDLKHYKKVKIASSLQQSLYYSLILSTVSILMIYFSYLFYGKRVRDILKVTEQFGEGKLRERTVVDGEDEIGSIAKSFNAMADKITSLAYSDYLTGLMNRVAFQEAINQKIELQKPFALIFVDIDEFNDINNLLGHKNGDKILLEFARKIKNNLTQYVSIARLSGDEFCILYTKENFNKEDLIEIADKILSVAREDFTIDKFTMRLTASIGISLYPEDGEDCETLLKNSEAATNESKLNGKNTYTFYYKEITNRYIERLKILSALKFAMEHKEFFLVYQPIIDASTNKIYSVETLLRWNNSQYPGIGPDKFVPLLEETGLIVEIGEWIIYEAALQLKKWILSGFHLHININVSVKQLSSKLFLDMLKSIVKGSGVDPSLFTIEITETQFMKDTHLVLPIIEKIRNIGIRIAMDDFGTGYSSLSYLKVLPLDFVKIDKSFVYYINNQNDSAIIKTIITLANLLGMTPVAEGVENENAVKFLKSLNCSLHQGYFYSKPLSSAELEQNRFIIKGN